MAVFQRGKQFQKAPDPVFVPIVRVCFTRIFWSARQYHFLMQF